MKSEKGGWNESGGKTYNVIHQDPGPTQNEKLKELKNDFSKLPREGDINIDKSHPQLLSVFRQLEGELQSTKACAGKIFND